MIATSAQTSDDHTPEDKPFRSLYRRFFDKAESKRRWDVTEDIPWDQVKFRAIDEDLVDILEAFYATEMYLPDYTSQLLSLNRQNQGMAWFIANWGYEESKHSIGLEDWLLRSGRRTEKQMHQLNEQLLQGQWIKPFSTSRQMIIYAMFQELATQLNYLNLSKATAPANDVALQKLLRLIASDEGVHHKMFVDCLKVHLELDREGTVDDIAHVLSNFAMPAHDQIPGFDRLGKLIEARGIYSNKMFIRRVMFPALKRIGVDRKELPLRKHRS